MKLNFGWIWWFLTLLLVACGGSCGAGAPETESLRDPGSVADEDEWAALLINGNHSGLVFNSRAQKKDHVITVNRNEISMMRGAQRVSMTTVVTAVESLSGEPRSFEVRVAGSGMNKHVKGEIRSDNTATIVTEIAGRVDTQSIPWPEDCLLIEGARQLSMSRGLTDGVSYSAMVFDFESLKCLENSYRVGSLEDVVAFDRKVSGHRVELESATSGGKMIVVSWVDDRFRLIRSMTTLAGMKFETIACDEKTASAPLNPSPIFTESFIDSPRPLSRSVRAGALTYRIQPTGEVSELSFPSSDEQRVSGNRVLEVVVQNRPLPVGNALKELPTSDTATEYLVPTSWIQSREEEIIALSKQAVGDAQFAGQAAINIERFVGKYIRDRSLAVGYASALETARSRAGDCTEFAVLSAALCRAAGIPARIVFGIVYMDQEFEGRKDFFGGHAWTQVLIDDEWYSIDAAFGGFDAGHVAVLYNDGAPENFVSLINTLGNFKILSVE